MSVTLPDTPISDASAELEFSRLLRSAAILLVDDESDSRDSLKQAFEDSCALLEVAGSAEEAEALRLRYHFDLLLVDIRLPGLSGLEWVRRLRERGVKTHVIYMTDHAELEMVIAALRNGADDFILTPVKTEQIFLSIQRTLMRREISTENSLLRLQMEQMQQRDGLVGNSEAMQTMLTIVRRVAGTRSTVFIRGEPGVGKALVARVIHRLSRRGGAFIQMNCGSADSDTMDRELFGHVKDACAGAEQTRDGLIVQADKGTLYLDDLECLSEPVLKRLLGTLERGVVRPIGSTREFPVDVRVIATLNSEADRVDEFSESCERLIFRLNGLPLTVPPLRERGQDIELLVQHFMDQLSSELRLSPVQLLFADWQKLGDYGWPGNVRELRNVVERTLLLGKLPVDSLHQGVVQSSRNAPGYPHDWSMAQVERSHIEAVLDSVGSNKSAAARLLGVSRKTLERKQALWHKADRGG